MQNINSTTGVPPANTNWADTGTEVEGPRTELGALAATSLSDAQLADLIATKGGASVLPTGTLGVNPDGSPVLPAALAFSADDMIDLLRNWSSKGQDAQLASQSNKIQADQNMKKANNETQMEKLKEWADKFAESKKQSAVSKIFGWIGKIFAVIASAVFMVIAAGLTGLTAGLGAPVMALAAMALVGSSMALADQISKECGGPEISLSNLITTAVSKTLEACGVDPEVAKRIGKVTAGAIAILLPAALVVEPGLLGTMATGIAELAGADANTVALAGMIVGMVAALTVGIVSGILSGGGAAVNSATKIALAITNISNAVVQGSMAIAKGTNDLKVAETQRDAELAKAEKEKLMALAILLQTAIDETMEAMKKVIKMMDEGVTLVSQMINSQADSKSQIAFNIGARAPI